MKSNLKILECSSAGNIRFSAFGAHVTIFGVSDAIEKHYQRCKQFDNPEIDNPKGLQPDYLIINGMKLDIKYLSAYYKLLWCVYLDSNPYLVNIAKQYDDFNDMYRGKNNNRNCQADVIREYIKQGRESIMSDPLVIELTVKLGVVFFIAHYYD